MDKIPVQYAKRRSKKLTEHIKLDLNNRESKLLNGELIKPESLAGHVLNDAASSISSFFSSRNIPVELGNVFARTFIIHDPVLRLRFPDGTEPEHPFSGAMYDTASGRLYIHADILAHPTYLLRVLIHELAHACDYSYMRVGRDANKRIRSKVKGGYQSEMRISQKEDEQRYELFRGLNEAVTELIMYLALAESGLVTQQVLQDIWDDSAYELEIQILMTIINALATSSNVDPREIQEQFVLNYTTGNMMFLRQIERLYGPQSVRILSRLGSYTVRDVPNEHRNESEQQLILEFFSTSDGGAREQLAKRILD